MPLVLVSACLLGEPVRFDGASKAVRHPVLERWLEAGWVVRLCPELAGGLGVPRPAAERQGRHIRTQAGVDVTEAFARGAHAALALTRSQGIRVAVLKENSPSCGSSFINDGSFSRVRVPGMGLTTEVLRAAGVQVFSEAELEAADAAVRALTTSGPASPPGSPSP